MIAIEVKNLSFSYGDDINAINDVSFKIEAGSKVALIGNNGSGKSTIAKLITGLVFPNNGEIYINGELLTEKSAYKLRNNIAIVFQNPDNQFIGSSVEDDIAFGLENRNVPTNEMQPLIDTALKKVHMEEFAKSEPSKLSGGQKQRIAIAGSIVLKPEILILDEATAMLDPQGKEDIINLVKELKHANPKLTVIAITHNISEIEHYDQIIVLEDGKILCDDNPDNVFATLSTNSKYLEYLPFSYQIKTELKNNEISLNSGDLDGIIKELCQLK